MSFVCSSGVTEVFVNRPEKPSVASQFVQSDLRPVLAFFGTGTLVSAGIVSHHNWIGGCTDVDVAGPKHGSEELAWMR